MELFPKEKLTDLYEKKLAEDEGYQHAMESFFSVEWNEIYSAIWQNNAFLNEVSILKENGIDVALMLFVCQAIIGVKLNEIRNLVVIVSIIPQILLTLKPDGLDD